MRYKLLLFFTWLIIISCLSQTSFTAEENRSPSRPAVIAIMDISSGKSKLSEAISLMTVKFSQNTSIKLVERQDIDKAIKELELSASQIVNRENTLKLGHMVRADGLVFLSLSDDGKIFRVRLVDTKYGLRLLDTLVEWKEEDINKIVDEIVPRVTSVIPKLLIPPEKEILIGILGIRNVDPSSTLNWLELTLPKLISSRLTQEPSIIVLEREDINVVLDEKLFTGGEESSFHGSMVLLEGEVKQVSTKEEDSHQFILSLQTKQANGRSKERFDVQGDTEKLVLVAEESTRWIVRKVAKATSEGTWDTKAEAEEFFKEAKVLMAHEDWLAARPLLETAHALEPENDEIIKCLLRQMQKVSHDIMPFERARLFRRYIELVDSQSHRYGEKSDGNLAWILFYELVPVWEYLNSSSSVQTEEVRAFNRQTRRYCDDLSIRIHNFSKVPEESYVYRSWKIFPLNWISAVSENPEDAMKRTKELIPWILQRPIEDRFSEIPWIQTLDSWFVNYNSYHIMSAGHLERQKVCELWIGFLEELTRMEDPIVKLFAELGLAKAFYEMTGRKKDDLQVCFHCDKALDILNKDLNYPNVPLTPRAWGVLKPIIRYILSLTSQERWFTKTEVLPPEIETSENLKIDVLCDLKEYLSGFDLRLLDIDKRLFSWWTNAVREKDIIWISSVNHYIREVWLIGINLKERNLYTFWRIPLPANANFTTHGIMNNKPVVSKDGIYLGIHGTGIIKFPGTEKTGIGQLENVDIITEKEGLFSRDITSVARINNKFYVGISSLDETESGFGVYNLEKREWKPIASSRSKDKTCTLNKERPFRIVSLTPTSDGKKLFFICNTWASEVPEVVIPGLGAPEIGGLWKMDIESEKMEQIWSGGFDEFISGEEKWWVGGGGSFIVSFDPVSEIGEITVCWNKDWYYSACKGITCRTEEYKPPSGENAYIIPESLNGRIALICDGLYKNAFWGLTDDGEIFSISINQSQSKLKEYKINTLDGNRITWLCPTSYGVVVAGGTKIGLIEENLEP